MFRYATNRNQFCKINFACSWYTSWRWFSYIAKNGLLFFCRLLFRIVMSNRKKCWVGVVRIIKDIFNLLDKVSVLCLNDYMTIEVGSNVTEVKPAVHQCREWPRTPTALQCIALEFSCRTEWMHRVCNHKQCLSLTKTILIFNIYYNNRCTVIHGGLEAF